MWPVSPNTTSFGERVTIPDREGQGQQASPPLMVDQRDPGAPEMDAFSRFRVGGPSFDSGCLP